MAVVDKTRKLFNCFTELLFILVVLVLDSFRKGKVGTFEELTPTYAFLLGKGFLYYTINKS